MKLAIIGTGHVGLVSAVCFAEMGYEVTGIDSDSKKIEGLKKGIIPIYEEGLKELLDKNKQKLKFTTSIPEGIQEADIIFICVGTPPKTSGDADLSIIEDVVTQIASSMKSYKIIVEKSTVPVQTGKRVKQLMEMKLKGKVEFDIASNPEFLREAKAIYDSLHPDRIVIGVESERAKNLFIELYKPINAPLVITNIESAELIKHASNSFLAMKISFINAVSTVCELSGADIRKVAEGIGLDKRIGKDFLNAGIGFGGFCFPKDLKAFRRIASKLGYEFGLLEEVEKINEEMKIGFVDKIENALWNLKDKTIGILGLAFKPGTEDMRYAPSIDIISALQESGAKIRAYDPEAMEEAKGVLKDITYCKDAYDVAKDSDCLCIVTEWDEFKNMDLKKIKDLLRSPIIIDGRNIFEKEKIEKLGFKYKGIGIKQ
ncbi:MAG: UDP-glucose/GDP-mannose dehydrogenase family protein [bacterium]|nr:UDP-glucose/GDP-mannose dehydrogenase family protein [bacterium]